MSISIGTITPLAPGSKATASLTGTAPNQVLNLGVPQNVSSAASVPVGPTQINGASVPISVNILGANALGQIVDNSSIVLSNSTTGNAATASAPQAGSTLASLIPASWGSFTNPLGGGALTKGGGYNFGSISTVPISSLPYPTYQAYSITFTTPLNNTNYAVLVTGQGWANIQSVSTTGFVVSFYTASSTGALLISKPLFGNFVVYSN